MTAGRLAAGLMFWGAVLLVPVGVRAQPERTSGSLPAVIAAAPADTLALIVPRDALLRSMALPGWGQFYTGHPIKGTVMLAGQGWFAGSALIAHLRVRDLNARRREETDPLLRSGQAADIEARRRKREIWARWAIVLWAYSFTDAFVDAHLYYFDRIEGSVSVQLGPAVDRHGPFLRARLALTLGRDTGSLPE